MATMPCFNIAEYKNNRDAVVSLLLYLRKRDKAVTASFMAEWFNLNDHSGISNTLKALGAEGHVVTKEVARAGRSKILYILRRGRDPRKPILPSKSDMIWQALCSAEKPITVADIALLTGVKKETVSSFVQRLARGKIVYSLAVKKGGCISGHRNTWSVPHKYRHQPTPKVKMIKTKKVAVFDE